jgi:hypothetical protein
MRGTEDIVSDSGQALEGKDVKDLLLNVGSGGGAAAAPTSGGGGGAAAGGDAAAPKEEEKEEGMIHLVRARKRRITTNTLHREGGVGRGYGLRSLRLNAFSRFFLDICLLRGAQNGSAAYSHCWGGTVTTIR